MARARWLCWSLLLAAAIGTWAGCSASDDGGELSPGAACKDSAEPACGVQCTGVNDCEPGYYCGLDGKCTADCRPTGLSCPSGRQCSTEGRCILVPSGNGGGPVFGADSGLNGNGATKACIQQDVGFERLTPTVIVLVDRSGSMTEDFGGGRDRWDTLRDVLVGPTGILRRVQDRVRIGLTTYTSVDGNRGGACPMLESVPPALNNFGPIEQMYRGAEIGNQEDDTPTPDSLSIVTQQLQAFPEVGPKVIILATDGEPDTCVDPDAHNAATNALAVQAVQTAYRAGIRTEVISVGDEVGQQHLQELANAGNGGSGGTPYRALDAQALISAFDAIIAGVVSCEFTLNGQVQAGKESRGKVRLGERDLAYQSPDGWVLTAPNRLLLQGAACAAVKRAEGPLHIEFPCDGFVKIM